MRTILTIPVFLIAASATVAEPLMDGPVAGGSFGMGGSDYYGDVRNRMPFTGEMAPQPLGVAEMERIRAARRRAEAATLRPGTRRAPKRRPPRA